MDVKKQFLAPFEYFYSDRVIHSVKTALACLIAFVVLRSTHFAIDQWILITIIVVMCAQINVGGMLHKSYLRFVGTLSGCVIALLTMAVFGHNQIIFAIVIAVSAAVFSYIATSDASFSEIGTLGAVTVVIILHSRAPSFNSALERFGEISIGILIASLVSQFVLPINARERLSDIQAETISKIRLFYVRLFGTEATVENCEETQALDEAIALSLIKQRKLATESSKEIFGKKFDLNRFKKLLQAEKDILRAIVAMRYAYQTRPAVFANISLDALLHRPILLALDKIALCFTAGTLQLENIFLPDVLELKKMSQLVSIDDKFLLDVFLFSTERLLVQLNHLIEILKQE